MPGVLIVEAMAQTGAVAVLSEEENRGRIAFFAGIDGVRFKRIVEPATSSSSSASWSGSAARSAVAVRPRRSAASWPREAS